MADYDWTKPTPGGSSGTWGAELNAILDVIQAHPGIKVVADATAKAAYVPLLGQIILQADTGKIYKCTNATGPVWAEIDAMTGVMTTEGDIIYQGASAPARLAKGTAGQRLQMNAGATAPEWVSPELTTKGDLLVYGSSLTRLGVGSDGQVLTADSAQALGVKWAAASGSGGGVPERWYVPGSADEGYDDEFDDGSIDADWVAVDVSGAGKQNSWYEPNGIKGLSLFAPAIKGANILTGIFRPLGDMEYPMYIETAIKVNMQSFGYPAVGLAFTDGVTYGAGNQVHLSIIPSSDYLTLGNFSNFTSRGTASDLSRHNGAIQDRLYIRLYMSAANTFQSYISVDGVSWVKIHADISRTLTPTHFGLQNINFDNSSYDITANFAYFRARSGAPANG